MRPCRSAPTSSSASDRGGYAEQVTSSPNPHDPQQPSDPSPEVVQPSRALPRRAHRGLIASAALIGGGVLLSLLSGCAVTVPPGPDAANPACADVITKLPDEVIGQKRQETTSQSTAAWGTGEKAVVLRCGVTPPPPTTELCTTTQAPNGTAVDWIVHQDDETGILTYTTYGREPAIDMTVPRAAAPDQPSAAPLAVVGLVNQIPATRFCVGQGETN